MKKLKLLVATFALLGVTLMSTPAMADEFKVAVIDIPQVVSQSAQVKQLQKDHKAKADDIVKFVEKARKDVASITDASKKKAAEEKYNKELVAKKEKMDKEYSTRLQAIDESITKQIVTKAQQDGYSLVISKNIVLYGGIDITNDIVKIVK